MRSSRDLHKHVARRSLVNLELMPLNTLLAEKISTGIPATSKPYTLQGTPPRLCCSLDRSLPSPSYGPQNGQIHRTVSPPPAPTLADMWRDRGIVRRPAGAPVRHETIPGGGWTLTEVRNRLNRICGGSNVEHLAERDCRYPKEPSTCHENRQRASLIAIKWTL